MSDRHFERAAHALYTVRERYETSDGVKISGIWGKGVYRNDYERLNRKFFNGKLPPYKIQIGYIETGRAVDYIGTGAHGHSDRERRRITLSQLGESVARHRGQRKLKTWVRRTLLQEMCRIAAGREDQSAYIRELKRLADMGEQWAVDEMPRVRSGASRQKRGPGLV